MRLFRVLFALVALGMFAACGSTTGSTSTVAPAEPTTATAPTDAPPTSAPTSAPQVSATQPAAANTYNGVAVSRTPEGYHVLGDPNAPQTIEFFSDFL